MLRLRRVAALRVLTAPLLAAGILAAGILAVGFLAAPSFALAADPTATPDVRPPTCSERFPAEGPAGVDLRLGCIVSELVGLYTPGQAATPPPISTYAIALVALALAVAGLAMVALRLLARRAGEALAPVMPDAWWQCPRCRSINGAGVTRCYSCGSPRPAEIDVTLATDETPGTPQSFGRGKHG